MDKFTVLLQSQLPQRCSRFAQEFEDSRLRNPHLHGDPLLFMAGRQEVQRLPLAGRELIQGRFQIQPKEKTRLGVEAGSLRDFPLRFTQRLVVPIDLLHVKVQNLLALLELLEHRGTGPSGTLNEKGPPQPALWISRLAVGLCPSKLPGPTSPLGLS